MLDPRRLALGTLLLTGLACPLTAHAQVLLGDLASAVGWALAGIGAFAVLALWFVVEALAER